MSGSEFKALTAVEKSSIEAAKLAKEARLIREVSTSPALPERIAFVESHRATVFVAPAQNARFIEMSRDAATQIKENKTRIFDGENASMKPLNESTKDKNLVTAMTNLQNKILLEKIKGLQDEFPGFTFDAYSDFKSIKIAVKSDREMTPEINDRLRDALDRAYRETNQQFGAEMKRLNITVDKVGDPKTWFKAGFGRTVDEASLASRRARNIGGEARVLDYSKPEVNGFMTDRLAQIEKSRQSLVNLSGHKALFEWSGGVSLPKEEVFALVRKNPNPDDLARTIRERYNLSFFSSGEAARLQEYINGVDEFSPTLLIGKRENATLDRASNGGVSADFLGMGAANLHATAKGIAGKYDLASALQGARQGEQDVTNVFRAKMEKFKAKVGGEVTCSGDDCVRLGLPKDAPLTGKEKQSMVQSLAASPDTRGVRLSFVGSGVPEQTRMQLASQGEAIEKVLRKELSGKIPAEKLDRITFGLDMQTTQLNQGTVNLIVGRSPFNRLTSADKIELQSAFERALLKSNKDESAYIQGTTQLRENTLILVPGPALLNELTDQNEN